MLRGMGKIGNAWFQFPCFLLEVALVSRALLLRPARSEATGGTLSVVEPFCADVTCFLFSIAVASGDTCWNRVVTHGPCGFCQLVSPRRAQAPIGAADQACQETVGFQRLRR